MMWPGPRSLQPSRSRFQCTTCQPPVPSPSSTAVVFTTTRSPGATRRVSWVSTYAPSRPAPRSTSTRWSPARSWRTPTILPLRNDGTELQGRDQPLDPLVARLEGVLAQDGALGLVVELQVHPVDGVIAVSFLGPFDECAPKSST